MSFSFLVYNRGLNRPHSSRQEKTAATGSNGGPVWLAPAPGSSHLLACSAAVDNSMSREHREIFGMRRLGEDRKGFFDQFHGTSLFKGAMKVVMTQSSTIYSAYLSDQLREDMKRDDLVNEGRLSRSEAEQQADEWAQQEWPKRWESFPRKLLVAYGKFHAMTLLMRVYEAVADRMYDDVTLDKLTIDTYSSTLRREKVGKQLTVRENFVECFWSNFIAYLADFSLHQIIITFGYLTYIREQRRRLSEARNNQEVDKTKEDLHAGSLLVSYTKKSASLGLTRTVGLFFASLGGAIGTIFWPGWGNVIGINMGDGLAISITDELVNI